MFDIHFIFLNYITQWFVAVTGIFLQDGGEGWIPYTGYRVYSLLHS